MSAAVWRGHDARRAGLHADQVQQRHNVFGQCRRGRVRSCRVTVLRRAMASRLSCLLRRSSDISASVVCRRWQRFMVTFYHGRMSVIGGRCAVSETRRWHNGCVSVLQSICAVFRQPAAPSIRVPRWIGIPQCPIKLRPITADDEEEWNEVRWRNDAWLHPWSQAIPCTARR